MQRGALAGLVAASATVALILVVYHQSYGAKATEELESTKLYIVPQANVLNGVGQRPVSSHSHASKAQKKHAAHKHAKKAQNAKKDSSESGWNNAEKSVAATVEAAMKKQQQKRQAAAKKAALADYWSNIRNSIHTEKHRESHLQGTRELYRAEESSDVDSNSESDSAEKAKQANNYRRATEQMASEKAQAGDLAAEDLEQRDNGIHNAALDSPHDVYGKDSNSEY